jgi:hypothetical protein
METLQVYGYLGVSDSGGLETSTNSEIEGNIMSLFSVSVSLGKKTYNFLDWFLVEDIGWGSDLNVPSLGTGLLIKLRPGCVCLNTW